MTARFRKSELERCARAMRDAGVDSYEIHFDSDGKPIVRVAPASQVVHAANDSEAAAIAEIEAWARDKNDAA